MRVQLLPPSDERGGGEEDGERAGSILRWRRRKMKVDRGSD